MRQIRSVPLLAATLTISVFAPLVTTPESVAQTAECLAAPRSAPPQGSHWYYRTDRATKRKCWYLASKDRKLQTVTPRAQTKPEPEATPEARPREVAPMLAQPEPPQAQPVQQQAQPVQAQPRQVPPQPQPAQPLVSPLPAPAFQWPDPPKPVPPDQIAVTNVQAPAPPAAPAATPAQPATADEGPASLAWLLLLAAAFPFGALSSWTIVRLAKARREWTDIDRYHTHLDVNASLPRVRSRIESAAGPMELPSAPPLEPFHQHDDVDATSRRAVRVYERAA